MLFQSKAVLLSFCYLFALVPRNRDNPKIRLVIVGWINSWVTD